MSDFAAVRRRLEAWRGDPWPDDYGSSELHSDIRLLLAELDRLKARTLVLEDLDRHANRDIESQRRRAEKAEAELAAERERAERLEKAARKELACLESLDCDCSICEALRPAAPDPTPSGNSSICPNCGREASINGCDFCETARGPADSEQPDLPLGHEFIRRSLARRFLLIL